MDWTTRELMLLCLLAFTCLVLAWFREEQLWAAIFAAEAAVAALEAVWPD